MDQNDHDLLIAVHTTIQHIQSDVKEMKDNTVGRLTSLESNKAEKKDVDDLKNVVNWQQKVIWGGLGIIAAAQLLMKYLHF